MKPSRHVTFPLFDCVNVVQFELSPAEVGLRDPWPVTVSLATELSSHLSPKYPALDALVDCVEDLRSELSTLSKYSTDFDDIVVPLVQFIRLHSAESLSPRQKSRRLFEKVCTLLDVFAACLSDVSASSAHHSLMRPIKELIVFPGDITCPYKRMFLMKLRCDYFPRAPQG